MADSREIVQWLRALSAPSEVRVQFPAHTHSGSQPLVTPVAGDLTPSSGLPGHQEHGQALGKTLTHITNTNPN